jgi:MoaA/NifB/PqqE/SkfB family radical SAM enzyme
MAESGFCTATGIAPVLQVHPTRRCNLACLHCYSASGPEVNEQLPLELLRDSVSDAAALGYRQLAVSGGEPLLYKHLPALLAHARARGMITSVTTNGMLATPGRWNPLAEVLDVAAISIDGRPDEHDVLRGQDGAFARTLARLPVIRDSGVPFGFIFTLTQHNVDSLEYVVQLAAREGARSVQVHPLTLYGRAATELPDDRPDALELWAALAEAARLGQALGVAVQVDVLSRQQILDYRRYLVPAQPVQCITAAAPILIVQADGIVVPFTHDVSPLMWLGSLNRAPLRELVREWLDAGNGDEMAQACEQAWFACRDNEADACAAAYWYDQVAAATRDSLPLLTSHPIFLRAPQGVLQPAAKS